MTLTRACFCALAAWINSGERSEHLAEDLLTVAAPRSFHVPRRSLLRAGPASARGNRRTNGTAAAVRFLDSAEREACAQWINLVAIRHLVALVLRQQAPNRRRELADRSDVMIAARAPSGRDTVPVRGVFVLCRVRSERDVCHSNDPVKSGCGCRVGIAGVRPASGVCCPDHLVLERVPI
jgi:hypothetical protein